MSTCIANNVLNSTVQRKPDEYIKISLTRHFSIGTCFIRFRVSFEHGTGNFADIEYRKTHGTRMSYSSEDLDTMAKTIYAEARGESEQGQEWVGHVIKNRSQQRGQSISQVCRQPQQFECWNGKNDITITERDAYAQSRKVAETVLKRNDDPTGGCDHYNAPDKEGYPEWTNNVQWKERIGGHQFYKE